MNHYIKYCELCLRKLCIGLHGTHSECIGQYVHCIHIVCIGYNCIHSAKYKQTKKTEIKANYI